MPTISKANREGEQRKFKVNVFNKKQLLLTPTWCCVNCNHLSRVNRASKVFLNLLRSILEAVGCALWPTQVHAWLPRGLNIIIIIRSGNRWASDHKCHLDRWKFETVVIKYVQVSWNLAQQRGILFRVIICSLFDYPSVISVIYRLYGYYI